MASIANIGNDVICGVRSVLRNSIRFVTTRPVTNERVDKIRGDSNMGFSSTGCVIMPASGGARGTVRLYYRLKRALNFGRVTRLSIRDRSGVVTFLSRLARYVTISLVYYGGVSNVRCCANSSFESLAQVTRVGSRV